MAKSPAFQLYAADFYMDTLTWETDDIGVYFCLLMAEWVNGPLDKDTRKLAKIAKKTHQKFVKNWSKISQKFVTICTENGEFFINERLEQEREKQSHFIEIQRQKGIKSGEIRLNRGSTVVQPQPQPEGNSSSSSSTSNNKPPIVPQKKGDEYDQDFISFWRAYPKKAKKPNAYREWKKLERKKPAITVILQSIQKQKTWRTWIDGFIPDPERWLKNERWLDEEPPTGGSNNGQRRYPSGGPGIQTTPPEWKPDAPISEEQRAENLRRIQEITGRHGTR